MANDYKEAASRVHAATSRARLAEVDCTENSKVCEKMGIQGYPTVKLFKNGKAEEEYPGQRTAEAFVSYVEKHLGGFGAKGEEVYFASSRERGACLLL